jgi:hypothetical protein
LLSDIAAAPFRAASLRQDAGVAAATGLQHAAAITDPGRRALLTGRLADVLVSIDPQSLELQEAILVLRGTSLEDPGARAEAAGLEGSRLLAAGDRAAAAASRSRCRNG